MGKSSGSSGGSGFVHDEGHSAIIANVAPIACFWIDAGTHVGGGHVARAQALAACLAQHGFHCHISARDVDAANRFATEQIKESVSKEKRVFLAAV